MLGLLEKCVRVRSYIVGRWGKCAHISVIIAEVYEME